MMLSTYFMMIRRMLYKYKISVFPSSFLLLVSSPRLPYPLLSSPLASPRAPFSLFTFLFFLLFSLYYSLRALWLCSVVVIIGLIVVYVISASLWICHSILYSLLVFLSFF
jgi:hypothetical protein